MRRTITKEAHRAAHIQRAGMAEDRREKGDKVEEAERRSSPWRDNTKDFIARVLCRYWKTLRCGRLQQTCVFRKKNGFLFLILGVLVLLTRSGGWMDHHDEISTRELRSKGQLILKEDSLPCNISTLLLLYFLDRFLYMVLELAI